MMVLIVILLGAILFVLLFGRERFLALLGLGGVLILWLIILGIGAAVVGLVLWGAGALLADFQDVLAGVFTVAVFGLAIYAAYDFAKNKLQDYNEKREAHRRQAPESGDRE